MYPLCATSSVIVTRSLNEPDSQESEVRKRGETSVRGAKTTVLRGDLPRQYASSSVRRSDETPVPAGCRRAGDRGV